MHRTPSSRLASFAGVSALLFSTAATGLLTVAGQTRAAAYAYANNVLSGGVSTGSYPIAGWSGQLRSDAGYAYSGPVTGTGSGHYYLTPFEAAYNSSDGTTEAQVTPGNALVLGFGGAFTASTSTAVNNGFNLGIHTGIGLIDTSPGATSSSANYSGSGTTGGTAATFSNPRLAYIAVGNGSQWVWYSGQTISSNRVTGTTWTAPTSGTPTLALAPANSAALNLSNPSAFYATTAVAPDGGNNTLNPPSGTPLADPSKAFTGTLASFNNEDYSQVISTLNGSAGGTWFNLASTGLTGVDEVALVVPSSTTYSLYVQAVVGVTTPEPAGLSLLAIGAAAILLRPRRKAAIRRGAR